jgi:hypothetical protein
MTSVDETAARTGERPVSARMTIAVRS